MRIILALFTSFCLGSGLFAEPLDGLIYAAKQGDVQEVIRIISEDGVDVDGSDRRGRTALTEASWEGHVQVVLTLLEHGAGLEVPDRDGRTPLMLAAMREQLAVMDVLIDRGADVNARDNSGMTALMWATSSGNMDAVIKLVLMGADIGIEDKDDKTAMDFAYMSGRKEILAKLRMIQEFGLLNTVYSGNKIFNNDVRSYLSVYINSNTYSDERLGLMTILKIYDGLLLGSGEEYEHAIRVMAKDGNLEFLASISPYTYSSVKEQYRAVVNVLNGVKKAFFGGPEEVEKYKTDFLKRERIVTSIRDIRTELGRFRVIK